MDSRCDTIAQCMNKEEEVRSLQQEEDKMSMTQLSPTSHSGLDSRTTPSKLPQLTSPVPQADHTSVEIEHPETSDEPKEPGYKQFIKDHCNFTNIGLTLFAGYAFGRNFFY